MPKKGKSSGFIAYFGEVLWKKWKRCPSEAPTAPSCHGLLWALTWLNDSSLLEKRHQRREPENSPFAPIPHPLDGSHHQRSNEHREIGRTPVSMAGRRYGCPGLTVRAVLDTETVFDLISLQLNAHFCWPGSFSCPYKVSTNPEQFFFPPQCTDRLLPS